MRTDAGSLKKGDFLDYQNDIWQVQKTDFNYQGRGMANVRVRVKSATTGKTLELNFKTTFTVETVDVDTIEMQYLYKDNESVFFMDKAYNQHSVPLSLVEFADFLKEGNGYYVLMYQDKPLTVRPPASVRLKVTQTEEAVKGDTVSGAKKAAVMESGVTIMVPLFVKVGDLLAINPETRQYVERVKE